MVLRGQNCFYWRFQCCFYKVPRRDIFMCQISKWWNCTATWWTKTRISWSLKIFIVMVKCIILKMYPVPAYITLDSCIIIIGVCTVYFTGENYITVAWGRCTNDTDRKLVIFSVRRFFLLVFLADLNSPVYNLLWKNEEKVGWFTNNDK